MKKDQVFTAPSDFSKERVDGAFIFFVAKEKSDRSSSMNHDWPSKSLFDDAPIFQIHLWSFSSSLNLKGFFQYWRVFFFLSSYFFLSYIFSSLFWDLLSYLDLLYGQLVLVVVHQGLLLSKDPGQFFERQSSKDPLLLLLLSRARKNLPPFARLSISPRGLASAIC